MKKMMTLMLMASILYACSNNNSAPANNTTTETTVASTDTKEPETDYTNDPSFQKGLELVKNSDCATCHKIDEKITGPAYRDIANKYERNDTTIASLAKKVIGGGTGVWGQVPMTAHTGLSESDAKQMVTYILMLRNKK